MHDLRPDQMVFGRYTLLRPLRSGARHPAWLATDTHSGTQVGLWLLPASALRSDLITQLQSEIPAAGPISEQEAAAVVLAQDNPAQFARDAALLERLIEQSGDENDNTAAEEFDSIEPLEFKGTATTIPAESERQRAVSRPVVIALFAVSIVIAVGVIFYLPELVKPSVPEPTTAAPATTQPTAAAPASGNETEAPKELAPWQRAQILQQKEAAEAVLEEFIRKQFDLEENNVNAWAEAEFNAAKEHARTGDGHFSIREYEAAQQSYQTGLDQLLALEALAPVLLSEALERGQAALETFDAAAASEAFQAALALDPDSDIAVAGLRRAETLDEVERLLTEGRRAESREEFSAARNAYREALALDSAASEAAEGLERVGARLASDQFSVLMSEGYAALSAGRLQQADSAFKRARQLKPGSPEVSEALAQTDMQRRLTRIASLRSEAERFESEENWSEALDRYAKALAIDANLAFAKRGRSRSQERTELDKRLTEYLAAPARLSTDAVYAAAEQLMSVVRKVEPRGPKLAAQIQQMEQAMAVARVPVTVRFESDNQTEVTLFRIGQLGVFASRDVELRPGTYTVVGTRSGFRDVRQKFTVVAGQPAGPVVVRCEEKI